MTMKHTLQRQVYVSERVKTLNEQIYYNIDALHAAISNNVRLRFAISTGC